MMSDSSSSKRILLLGAVYFGDQPLNASITSFDANSVSSVTTLCDFDVVVVHLAGLRALSEASFRAIGHHFRPDSVRDFLRAGGHIVAFGDPKTAMCGPPQLMPGGRQVPRISLASTMGIVLNTVAETGDRFQLEDGEHCRPFRRVLQTLRGFTSTLSMDARLDAPLSRALQSGAKWMPPSGAGAPSDPFDHGFPRLVARPIASSRAGSSLAMVAEVRNFSVRGHETPRTVAGTLAFLPQPAFTQQLLRFLLEDGFGVTYPAPPPWLSSLRVVAEEDLDRAAEEATTRIALERQRMVEVQSRREIARRDLDILWLKGTALEEPVFRLLEGLGARVRRPLPGANNEEAWLEVDLAGDTRRAVLEVKSTSKDQVGKDGTRQLDEWVARAAAVGDICKGILIANTAVEQLPSSRPSPFPSNVCEAAVLSGHVLMSTWTLHLVSSAVQSKALDALTFWRTVFATKGPLGFSDIILPSDT